MTMTVTTKKKPPAARKRPPAASAAKQTAKTAKDEVTKAAALHPANPLVATVPDMAVADKYVSRKVNGVKDFDLFDYCFENGVNLLLEGPTGPGKTMATRAWAAKRGKRVARIPSNNGIDTSQLFGKFNPDKTTGGFTWVYGPVPDVFLFGGVILWNEINFTPERVGSIMFGALDDNREIVLLDHDGEVIRAHRGAGKCWCALDAATCDDRRVLIVADMNPGYAGTRDLNDALRNRFGMQVSWGYDADVEASLVMSKNLLIMANQIRSDEAYETPVSTNMLMEFEKIAADLGIDFAIGNFVNHFRADERAPIALVAEASKGGIEKDFAPPPPPVADDGLVPDPDVTPDDADFANVGKWLFGTDD